MAASDYVRIERRASELLGGPEMQAVQQGVARIAAKLAAAAASADSQFGSDSTPDLTDALSDDDRVVLRNAIAETVDRFVHDDRMRSAIEDYTNGVIQGDPGIDYSDQAALNSTLERMIRGIIPVYDGTAGLGSRAESDMEIDVVGTISAFDTNGDGTVDWTEAEIAIGKWDGLSQYIPAEYNPWPDFGRGWSLSDVVQESSRIWASWSTLVAFGIDAARYVISMNTAGLWAALVAAGVSEWLAFFITLGVSGLIGLAMYYVFRLLWFLAVLFLGNVDADGDGVSALDRLAYWVAGWFFDLDDEDDSLLQYGAGSEGIYTRGEGTDAPPWVRWLTERTSAVYGAYAVQNYSLRAHHGPRFVGV